MPPLALLALFLGAIIQIGGFVYAVLQPPAGTAVNLPVLIGALVVGSMLELGGVLLTWHLRK